LPKRFTNKGNRRNWTLVVSKWSILVLEDISTHNGGSSVCSHDPNFRHFYSPKLFFVQNNNILNNMVGHAIIVVEREFLLTLPEV
jgi:hypothetical protein